MNASGRVRWRCVVPHATQARLLVVLVVPTVLVVLVQEYYKINK